MAYGWEGEKVRLVPLDKEKHAANVVLWMNDPDVTETILSGDIPLTRLAEEEFFERMAAPAGQHPTDIIFAIETLGGEHIGTCGMHQINYRHGVALTGTIIGAAEFEGRGYGTDAAIGRRRRTQRRRVRQRHDRPRRRGALPCQAEGAQPRRSRRQLEFTFTPPSCKVHAAQQLSHSITKG